MKNLIYSKIVFGLLIFLQITNQKETDFGKTENSIERECKLEFKISNEGEFFYLDKPITENEISDLVKKQLIDCSSQSKIKIYSGMELGYQENHEKLEKIILKSIINLQNDKSLEKFGVSLNSTTPEQFQMIEKIYPSTISFEFCCTEH